MGTSGTLNFRAFSGRAGPQGPGDKDEREMGTGMNGKWEREMEWEMERGIGTGNRTGNRNGKWERGMGN